MKNKGKAWKKYCNERYSEKIWCIGYRKLDGARDSLLGENNDCDFQLLLPSFRYWYADPICHYNAEGLYVFMEAYDMAKGIGRIAVSKYLDNGKLTKPQIIIKEDFHLSFPEIFRYRGETYLIPESHSVNQIRIYRMQNDVFHWELYYISETQHQYSDSVVYLEGGNIFLLCTSKAPDSNYKNKLSVFEIENLENPSLIRFMPIQAENNEYTYAMRNGGSICQIDEIFLRVIQGAEEGEYGKNIHLREINYCGRSSGYSETEDVKIISIEDTLKCVKKCRYDISGIHTYGLINNFEVIDLKITIITFYRFVRYYKNVFSTLLSCIVKRLKRRKRNA